jgi:hypothetical protein
MGAYGRRDFTGVGFVGFLLFLTYVGACSAGPESLRFAAMGDMGTGGPGQRKVAAMMAERAREEPFQFWFTLGDNIYPWGVLSPDDPQWEERFESVYDDPTLQVPVYGTLGNHDYLGLPLAQVERSARSDIWTMPDRYYAFSSFLADGTEVAFFALDTEMILSGIKADIEDTPLEERMEMVQNIAERGEAEISESLARYIAERVHAEDGWAVWRVVILADQTDREVTEGLVDEVLAGSGTPDYPSQLDWLRRSLSESDARWKIVFGHQPLYSHNPWRGASPNFPGGERRGPLPGRPRPFPGHDEAHPWDPSRHLRRRLRRRRAVRVRTDRRVLLCGHGRRVHTLPCNEGRAGHRVRGSGGGDPVHPRAPHGTAPDGTVNRL